MLLAAALISKTGVLAQALRRNVLACYLGDTCTANVHTWCGWLWQVGVMTGWLEPFLMTEQDISEEVSDLCAKLRAARKHRGLSVRRIAAAASVAPFTVTRVEAGRVVPSWITFTKLANASEYVVGVRDFNQDWGETSSGEPVVDPRWLPGRGVWWEPRGSDWEVWLQLRAVGSELHWARQWAFPNHEITEAEASRILGMSRTTIHAIERLAGNPLLSSVVRLADLTGREIALREVGATRPITAWEATQPPKLRQH